jgi:hypothetical protein
MVAIAPEHGDITTARLAVNADALDKDRSPAHIVRPVDFAMVALPADEHGL